MPTSPSKSTPALLDSGAILAELEEGGAVAQKLTHYEPRESQLGLMRLIIRAFNEDALCAAEAGTGVGKSFAYLLPAVIFAEKSGERVVISTATITLQQQLFEKDLPLVIEAIGSKIKTALVKGRGNFLCPRRLDEALSGAAAEFDFEQNILEKIASWAKKTKSGAKSDMPFLPEGSLWASIASDADTCLGMRCAHRESCFFMTQRREAADAKVLVVNHHLLFSDLAARAEGAGYGGTVVLPSYKRIVIDEAHTIEDAATSFFSGSLSRYSLNRNLTRLLRQKGAQKKGLLLRLNAFAGGGDRSDEWLDAIDAIRAAAAHLDSKALELCGTESVFRFIPQRDKLISDYLETGLLNLKTALARFSGGILELTANAEKEFLGEDGKDGQEEEDAEGGLANEVEILFRETRAAAQRLAAAAEICAGFLDYKAHPEDVFWVERRGAGRGDFALWTRAPVDIAAKLAGALFSPYKTVVCVSATLTVSGRFDYWMLRTGITKADTPVRDAPSQDAPFQGGAKRQIFSGNFPSPFPYERSVLLAAPADAPLPSEPEFRAFVQNAVVRLVEAAGGSALVLWTSFESLESCFSEAAPALEAQGIRCLKQGDDDRSRLLRAFLTDESSVLFATDSFWEGVDAPGDTLRLVILCRLPFKMPNDPVFEARCEAVEKQGGNAFMNISIPEAVIKLRQGFGRLMRRSSDHGVVAVLDSRVIKKRYGEIFLRSLPKTKYCFLPFAELTRTVERFLEQ